MEEGIEAAEPLIGEILLKWGPWGAFLVVFLVFGLPHVAAIVREIGAIVNERYKAKLAHTRAMQKISNQIEGTNTGSRKGEP